MPQISTKTIQDEFNISTNFEKHDFVQNYATTVDRFTQTLKRISQTVGDRIFFSDHQIKSSLKKSFSDRANTILLSLNDFASDLVTQNLEVVQAMMAAELLSRNLARQLSVPRDQALKELKKMRPKVQNRFFEKELHIAKIASNMTGSKTDKTSQSDPFQKLSEYSFYDAFAIIRGPRRVEIIDFNNDVMSVTVNLTNEINPGSFNITLTNPLEQYVDDYGIYAFYTGDTIRIFATNRFQKPGKDRYSHIFWGILEQVQDEYSDGVSKITLSGQDITAWFQYTTIQNAPTLLTNLSPQIEVNKYGHKYANMSTLAIIADILFNNVTQFSTLTQYSANLTSQEKSPDTEFRIAQAKAVDQALVAFWNDLWKTDLKLKIIGFTGTVELDQSNASDKIVTKKVTNASGGTEDKTQLVQNGEDVCSGLKIIEQYIPIRMFEEDNFVKPFQIEDTPKLEVIRRAIEGTMFEFFMDVDGSLVLKPPFYNEYPVNNDTKRYDDLPKDTNCQAIGNFGDVDKVAASGAADEYTIKDLDIVTFTLKEDSSSLVTRQEVVAEQKDIPAVVELNMGGYQNNDLVMRYGLRVGSQKKIRMLDSSTDAIVFAKGLMDFINLKYYSGTIQIIGRPELHLGRTIFLEARNVILYIAGISHNFTAGGTFTTTLTVTAGRRMLIDKDGQPRKNIFDGEQFESGGLGGSTPDASQSSSVSGKQDAFNNVRTNGYYTDADQKAIGAIPRRISDSFGRRLYGTLPYGLRTTPPKQNPNTDPNNLTTKQGDKTGAGQNPLSGNPAQTQTNPGGGNATGNPNIDTQTTADQQAQNAQSGGGQGTSGQKTVNETVKSCSSGQDNRAFNPSSIVKKRIINSGFL